MKLFGSLKELVSVVFRKNSQEITLRPNQATTYTANRDIQTPPQDANSVLLSTDATQTLTNKTLGSTNTLTGATAGSFTNTGTVTLFTASDTVVGKATTDTLTNKSISGSANTLTNIPLATAVTGQLATANGGTGQNSTATFPTSGVVVTEAASETLTNKTISGSSNTLTVLAGTQLSGQAPIANGGTGQSTKAAAFDALSPLSTKGDLISYSTTNARLAVGSDGQVLTADSAQTLGVKWATSSAVVYDAPDDIQNYTLTATVAANALTISLKTKAGATPSGADPVNIAFRNATLATGDYTVVQATGSTTVGVPSGTTLGTINGIAAYLYVYAINNAGTIELAVSNGLAYDEQLIQSSTSISGGSTVGTLYSSTGRTSKAIRYLGRLLITESTAGTWASTPSEISINRLGSSVGVTANSYTSSWALMPARTKQITLSVSGTGWTTTTAVGILYNDGAGIWRIKFNIQGTTGNKSSQSIAIANITFASGNSQAVAVYTNQVPNANFCGGGTNGGTNNIDMFSASGSTATWRVSGDCELSGPPAV